MAKNSEKKYKCSNCNRIFSTEEGLISHAKAKNHAVSIIYDCPKCDKIYKNSVDLSKHIAAVHNFCQFCKAKFKSPNDLKQHINDKHLNPKAEGLPQTPSILKNLQAKTKNLIKKVKKVINPILIRCSECGRIIRAEGLEHHIHTKHNPKLRYCPLCNNGFKSKYELRKHREAKKHYSPEEYFGELFLPLKRGKHVLNLWADGGTLGFSGRKGPSSYAFIIKSSKGDLIMKDSRYIGKVNNYIAEYSGILNGLVGASKIMNKTSVNVFSDCGTVVNHIKGNRLMDYPYLLEFDNRVKDTVQLFQEVEFHHVSRYNSNIQICDRMCTSCLKKTGVSKIWPYFN